MLKRIKKLTKDLVKEGASKFPKNYKTLTMCESCYAFKYHNSWHFKKPEGYVTSEHEVPVIFTQCTACVEQENAMFEAESELREATA